MKVNPTRVAATLVVTGAIAGGGAAFASAATGSTSTTPANSTTTTHTAPTTPSRAKASSGTHHCPGMSGASGAPARGLPTRLAQARRQRPEPTKSSPAGERRQRGRRHV